MATSHRCDGRHHIGRVVSVVFVFAAIALLAPLGRSGMARSFVGLVEAKGELKNTWTYMSSACKTDYYDIITTYYYRQAVCKYLLFAAFNSTDPANCPATYPGSDVWQCLRGGTSNNTAVYNIWWNFIGSCDLLWVAFRAPLTEGEASTPGTVTGEGESSSNVTAEEYAILSHEAYENGGVEVPDAVIPNYGAGEGESGRRRSLKATSTDEGESSEFDGLSSYDNSCFMRFDSMEQLGQYLTANPLTWNSAAGCPAYGSAHVLLWTVAASVTLLAVLVL